MLELWLICSLRGNGVTRVIGKVGWPAAKVNSNLLCFRLAAGKTIETDPAKNVSTDHLITGATVLDPCFPPDPKWRPSYLGLTGNKLLNWPQKVSEHSMSDRECPLVGCTLLRADLRTERGTFTALA